MWEAAILRRSCSEATCASRSCQAAILLERFVRRIAARRELRRRKAAGASAAQTDHTDLYAGAEDHGTRERSQLLQQLCSSSHPKPKDTLQVTWMDDDAPAPDGPPPTGMEV